MYLPPHFEEARTEELHRVITDCPLGILVLNGPHGLDANHLPFELNPNAGERGQLLAHVARANPLWQEARAGEDALVIFRAANAYISPNWYPSKHEFHRQAPTWNYQAVHVHGKITIRDDERFVRGVVARLTRVNEARAGSDRPWRMTDSSKEYIDQMLTAIAGHRDRNHPDGRQVEAQSESGRTGSHQRGRRAAQARRAGAVRGHAQRCRRQELMLRPTGRSRRRSAALAPLPTPLNEPSRRGGD